MAANSTTTARTEVFTPTGIASLAASFAVASYNFIAPFAAGDCTAGNFLASFAAGDLFVAAKFMSRVAGMV